MTTLPSPQSEQNRELRTLLEKADLQLGESRKVVDFFRQQLSDAMEAINGLIKSNNELANALRVNLPDEERLVISEAMELSRSMLSPRNLANKEYFNRADGKVLLELCKALVLNLSEVTVSDIAIATGYPESTVDASIRSHRNFQVGPNTEYGSDISKSYEIRKVAKNTWSLVKLSSESLPQ